MSVIDPPAGRPQLILRRATRHNWGPDPARVVMVAVLRTVDGASMYAETWGADGSTAVLLEHHDNVTLPRSKAPVITLADGTTLKPMAVGCSCNVPKALVGFNPARAPR